jgi:hypothetical protein
MSPDASERPVTRLVDRRGFLHTVAGGSAAVAVASLVPAGCAPAYPDRRPDGGALESLTPKQYGVARAAAEAMLAGLPIEPDAVAAGIDRELALVGDPVRADMKTVLSLIEHGTILSGRPRRFTALAPTTRALVLRHWATSRFNLRRAAYQALRGFVVYFAYSDDASRAITRFPGPWNEAIVIPAYPVDFGDIA